MVVSVASAVVVTAVVAVTVAVVAVNPTAPLSTSRTMLLSLRSALK